MHLSAGLVNEYAWGIRICDEHASQKVVHKQNTLTLTEGCDSYQINMRDDVRKNAFAQSNFLLILDENLKKCPELT